MLHLCGTKARSIVDRDVHETNRKSNSHSNGEPVSDTNRKLPYDEVAISYIGFHIEIVAGLRWHHIYLRPKSITPVSP